METWKNTSAPVTEQELEDLRRELRLLRDENRRTFEAIAALKKQLEAQA